MMTHTILGRLVFGVVAKLSYSCSALRRIEKSSSSVQLVLLINKAGLSGLRVGHCLGDSEENIVSDEYYKKVSRYFVDEELIKN